MASAKDHICRICGLLEEVEVESKDFSERWIVRYSTCGDYTFTRSVVGHVLGQPLSANITETPAPDGINVEGVE